MSVDGLTAAVLKLHGFHAACNENKAKSYHLEDHTTIKLDKKLLRRFEEKSFEDRTTRNFSTCKMLNVTSEIRSLR